MDGLVSKGIYDKKDIVTKFPFLNFSDSSYFETGTKEILEPGTKVTYDRKKYYIIGTVSVLGNPREYRIRGSLTKQLTLNDIDIRYHIAKSMTDREKDWRMVYESSIKPYETYRFINSEGCIHQAYLGEYPDKDDWRKMTDNMYSDKAHAEARKQDIINNHNMKF